MRYLNKIVFINSASIKYAEIELDGNTHLIGTQGVGKSTLLRAILFFYNANKTKLGIPREKKGFDDYYFEYQNSYIIYEVVKDSIPFCVLAYKVNGKVAFRFFDSEYKSESFVDDNNRAFENWEKIRNSFGKEIHYTPLISNYEDFRRIIYGDNKGLNAEFRKYALIESKQYQNIPRTIQNVLLNSNLEAKFIKDTIINSLNEDEFIIDIENYHKSHLRDFETQINDIKIWFNKNKKGQIIVRNQAERVIEKYRIFNYLNREKKELASSLNSRVSYIESHKPILLSNFSNENNTLISIFKKKENLQDLHLKREQKIISEIDYIKKELTKAGDKQTEYNNQNITDLIEKVAQKSTLTNEQKTLVEEKNILTSSFGLITQKYEALLAQVQNQHQEYTNTQNAEKNNIQSSFSEEKSSLIDRYQLLISQIKGDHKAEQEKASNELKSIENEENRFKNKKSELKHQSFFVAEIEKCKGEKETLNGQLNTATSIISNSKNKSQNIRKEWELETKDIERNHTVSIEKEIEKNQKFEKEIEVIQNKIKQSKSSLYGWLNDTIPNWENTIGKVIDEDNVLFISDLNPQLIDKNANTFFGVELNLNALKSRIKTVKYYNLEIEELQNKIKDIQKTIKQTTIDKDGNLLKLKTKFQKIIKDLKDSIAENEYNITQVEEKLKKNKIEWNEWIEKSQKEKGIILSSLESELDKIASQKIKAQEQIKIIKKGIDRKVTLKEKERDTEISNLNTIKNTKIEVISTAILANKKECDYRILELKKQQTSELDDKGADTKRLYLIDVRLGELSNSLDFITINERIVIEFEKDKRELFDKIPELKANKLSLEKKQNAFETEHKIEIKKLEEKYSNQKEIVENIQSKRNEFEIDENKFLEFKKSETFTSIQIHFSDATNKIEDTKTAVAIISEINDKHYKGIETFKELQQAINNFNGNFNEHNIFSFKVKLNEDLDYLNFALDLKEFVEADKINEFEKRVNERFANIIRLIGRETTELNSKEAEIEKIIRKINDDFVNKNFVQAIKEMEMRTQKSSNSIVKLLIQIKEFNDENSVLLGESNLFTSSETNSKNQKAVELLKQLVKELEKSKNTSLTLSESFDLQFRIVENDNDSGWVEKLSDVGSKGTDILVKAMINISLLNVFKESASKQFKDFKLHCMMDEIGTLHPTNQKGILRFANERNILLINGSPTSQNATDYKYTYKLAKEQSKTDAKKYITKINRLIKVNTKILD
ncbi:ATP-binding protein [Flavobacterium ovatum]|uniref:ATP-binding protein n=1 Tax=Flavobacterium ovatum TaxID=1928857 RepID=UPI00344B0BE3